MTTSPTAARQIVEEVTSWPGVEATPGSRGELSLRVGRREIGHLHGDHAAHFGFPRQVWEQLLAEGRVVPHPIARAGWAARRIVGADDVREVIALLRLNYDRAVARQAPAAAEPRLESPLPGLYASSPEPLPFARSLHIRAFLLRRERGNVLLYSVSGLETDAGAIEHLGGISRWYLNHRHEAMFASDWVSAPLVVHEQERASVAERADVAATFSSRHLIEDDLEAIPTPGHTPGATAYIWDSGEHRLLFTGDTVFLDEGEWVAAVLESSDRDRYVESLELLRELDFDVLVPWAATEGQPYYALTDGADARRRIDAILERLRRGENR